MRLIAKAAVVICMCMIGQPHVALAKTSQWMTAKEARGWVKREIIRPRLLMKSVRCKYTPGPKGEGRQSTLLKFTYGANPSGKRWRYAWGNRIPFHNRRNVMQGYKMVSNMAFRRPSGLKLGCAVWQR